MDWTNYVPSTIVNTPNGIGVLVGFDMIDKTVTVSHAETGVVTFPVEKISWKLGTIPAGLSMLVGQFVLLFQHVETMNKNFLRNTGLCDSCDSLTAGKLVQRTDNIIAGLRSDFQWQKEKWNVLKTEYYRLNEVRTDLIHGQRFQLIGPIVDRIDVEHIFHNLSKPDARKLNRNDLNALIDDVQNHYYQLMHVFDEIGKKLQN